MEELRDLIVQFNIGNYRGVITQGASIEPRACTEDAVKIQRDCYVYRSYIALGQMDLVISEVAVDTESTALSAIRALACYLGTPSAKEASLSVVDELRQDASASQNPTVALVGAIVLEHEQRFEDALTLLHPIKTLESRAMKVKLYLAIDRLSNAEKEYAHMQSADDDDVLTHLSAAWLCLYSAGSKVKEALNIYEELVEKFQGTPLLLNGVAAANMHLGNWDEAETSLKEAFEQDPSNQNILVNLSICASNQGKSTIANRYLSQVKTGGRGPHLWIQKREQGEIDFSAAASKYAATSQ